MEGHPVTQTTMKSPGSLGLPWWFPGKEPAGQAGDASSIPGLGRSPREGNVYPLQCSFLENPMDTGAWWAVHGLATEQHQPWSLKFFKLWKRINPINQSAEFSLGKVNRLSIQIQERFLKCADAFSCEVRYSENNMSRSTIRLRSVCSRKGTGRSLLPLPCVRPNWYLARQSCSWRSPCNSYWGCTVPECLCWFCLSAPSLALFQHLCPWKMWLCLEWQSGPWEDR